MRIQNRLFYAIAAMLFLANTLVMNDLTSLWDGAEAWIAWLAVQQETGRALHEAVLPAMYGQGLFWFRLPGAVLLVLAMLLYAWISGRLWGQEATAFTLLVLGASLLLPNLAKLATGDIWAMATQWLAFATLLRFLKQPRLLWQALFYLLLFAALWVQPINAFVFLVGLSVYLYFAHPQGRNLARLQPWLAAPLAGAALYALGMLSFDFESFVIGFRSGRFLLWNFLGLLPFWGFWMAGLWESLLRARRGEEMARINLGAFIFALLGHSLALQGVLALLIAKQWQGFSQAAYPHRPLVLAGSVLHLVGALFAAILLMIAAFHEFGPVGFRAGASLAGAYWMLSFVGAIGLLGGNRRYLLGGTALAGLLATTFFCLQINPLVEGRRNRVAQLVEDARGQLEAGQSAEGISCRIFIPPGKPFPKLAPYAGAAFPGAELLETEEALRKALASPQQGFILLPEEWAQKLAPGREAAARADGWDDGLKAQKVVLLKY